jgi:hypothetical protein
MKKSLLLILLAVGLAFAAKSYSLTLNVPEQIAGTDVPSGTYALRVEGEQVIFKGSHAQEISIPAKVSDGNKKFDYTFVESSHQDGKDIVTAIHLAGSHTTLEFSK